MAKDGPPTIQNRKARHDYAVLDSYEAGIVLKGSEVKAIRDGQANLRDAYATVRNGEVWLHGMHVSPYSHASTGDHDPLRTRKLLLHHAEIAEIARKTEQSGVTLIPMKLYFSNGRAKVDLAVARGKRQYDKRQTLRERDDKREAERALRGRNR